jgi:hypothetical protein
LVQEDASIDNHDNHNFSSPNTSPISDEGILVKEDTIIENHESIFFPSPSPPLEYIMKQEEYIIKITLSSLQSYPNTSPNCENALVKEDTFLDYHKNIFFEEDILVLKDPMIEIYIIITPFPNVPNIWKDLFEQKGPIIGKH